MDQLMKLGPFAALGKLWNDLSSAQRAVVVAFVALAVVVGTFTAVIASKPRMAVLFSGLAQEDAGAIVQKLNDEKVAYELSGDGGTVEVPADKVYDLRLKMATQGLPQGGSVGFELFDKSSFGMTEFAEKLNYQRAIQGELTRTICQLRPVVSARVHITIPEDKVFESEQQPAKASIALKLRRGSPLSDEQVGGIVHLVSSAVEGLKPENIDVIDQDGNALSESTSATGSGGMLSANQSKMKHQYETEVAQNLQSMLTQIVGPEKSVVRVSADMNFDQKQTKSETFEPAAAGQAATAQAGAQPNGAGPSPAGVMLSQETSSEAYNGSVVPPAALATATKSASSPGDNYKRSTTTAQYQVSRKTEETSVAPGQLKRLSVAVLVDKSVSGVQVSNIRQAVNAAAGIDQTRGDQVTVQAVAFDTSTQKQVAKEMADSSRNELIGTLAKNGGAVILLIGFLVVLRSIVTGIKVQAPSVNALAREPQFATPSLAAQAAAQAAAQQAEQQIKQSSHVAGAELPPEVSESNPEELARLVRSWMAEK
jgi:flagellar M-ring protein FliF